MPQPPPPRTTHISPRSGRKTFLARLALSPSAYLGLALLALFVATALFGPLLAPYDPEEQNILGNFTSPSSDHLFGTDQNGRDVLSMMLHGARIALIICGSVVAICAIVGLTLGIIAGYYGGIVDEIIMRIVDVLMAFPGILLNIAIVATVARPGVGVLIFALALNGWVGYARVARGQVLSVREREYVSAARCIGASSWRIMYHHILPNILSPIVVQMTFAFGTVILVEASLSFLGLGPQVPYTWGALLDQGATFMWKTQRLAIVPGAAIMLVVLGANLFGDGLRDRFDPRRQKS
jgi:peptide/nickel transport system permease protein